MTKDIVYKDMTVGEIVTTDFRAAGIFREAGIDFCCGGDKSLEAACKEKNMDKAVVLDQLNELAKTEIAPNLNFNEWDLGFLADYIVNTHHKFVQKSLPDLLFYTQRIATVHGEHHHELVEIAYLFGEINRELLQHLQHEEEVLFPAIKAVLKSNRPEDKAIILSEITRMKGEHEFAGEAMDKINSLSKNYMVPDDGCGSYKLAYTLLNRFEDDLHVHVHLENNILYPKALEL
jgi:regulator of cell morphogenesis and NO signaling